MAKIDDTERMLDELVKGKNPEELLGKEGVLKQLTKRLVERALEGEMTTHLGYEKSASEGKNMGNSRNGKTSKQVKADFGEVDLEVPRDRNGDFEPQLVKKGQRRLPGFDDKVIALYARGMTTREIQGHLHESPLRGCSCKRGRSAARIWNYRTQTTSARSSRSGARSSRAIETITRRR